MERNGVQVRGRFRSRDAAQVLPTLPPGSVDPGISHTSMRGF
jgi:hypothetical protein